MIKTPGIARARIGARSLRKSFILRWNDASKTRGGTSNPRKISGGIYLFSCPRSDKANLINTRPTELGKRNRLVAIPTNEAIKSRPITEDIKTMILSSSPYSAS